MPIAPRMLSLALILSAIPAVAADARRSGSGPSGVWIGQDGHDLVGPSTALAGSDVQDLHIALRGLPANREVVHAIVRGLGGDDWQFRGPPGPWGAALARTPGATTADLYLEPSRVETGRPFDVRLEFDDGRIAEFTVQGGRADPNRRATGAAMSARWVGQDRHDRIGPSPAVGPDGFQDAHLTIAGLSAKVAVAAIAVDGPDGSAWRFGTNPKGLAVAELERRPNDPSRADLFLSPRGDLGGRTLRLTVAYTNGKSDTTTVVAGRTDPRLRMAYPAAPAVAPLALKARWLGQDGSGVAGLGDVHVALEGLPAGRPIVAAALSDPVRGCWVFLKEDRVRFNAGPEPWPMALRRQSPTRADLFFAPYRNEAGATMTLRLLFEDGGMAFTQLDGGPCVPDRRADGPATESIDVRPGDDLQAVVGRAGRVRLATGTYGLDRPLVLERPIAITAEPGARIVFSQGADDPPWTTAIKIHAAHTTLDGFAVRFDGPIRWASDVQFGPAIIGTTDNLDHRPDVLKVGLAFLRLDIEGPPASRPGTWEEAPHLLRLISAAGGRIVGNRLKGGRIEIAGGPWLFADNDYRGTPPWTFAQSVVSCSRPHDLIVRGNRARPVEPSGKTWRFLVLTQSGCGDLVADNVIEGIGPRDGDAIPDMNAAEVILTEAYRLHFEGRPASISADGRVVQIPAPQGEPARTGDVVAILSGPEAGRFRRILQAIGPTAYLLDAPLPHGDYAISIATGFVGETFRNNRVDCRGSAAAAPLVLVGNHYGTSVVGNTLLGGGEAFKITAAPTEQPGPWGWSHAPFLGGRIAGNTIEDTLRGGTLSVEHGSAIRSNRGRVYMSMTLESNSCRWSDAFQSRRLREGAKGGLVGFTIGDPGSIDTKELVLGVRGNHSRTSGAVVRVNAAAINGQPFSARSFTMPADPDAISTARPSGPNPTR